MDYHRFIWQETAPGQYERETDEAEQFYTSIAKMYKGIGHTVFAVTACVSLNIVSSSNLDISSLNEKTMESFRSAWKKMRFDHPTLAAPVVYDANTKKCKKVYKSPASELDLDNWLKDTFEVIDNGQTGEEFADTDPPVGATPKLYIVKPAQDGLNGLRHDIVFRSSHDIIDGLGSFYLFNNFLLHASAAFSSSDILPSYTFNTQSGRENLSPPLRLAANIPHSPTEAQSSKLASTRTLNAGFGSAADVTVLSVPFSTHSTKPGKSQREEILLTAAQTASIISACKERGITPTQAIHASIAIALAALQPSAEASQLGRYISYAVINLRKSCVPPYDSAQHPVSVYHTASALRLVVDTLIPSKSENGSTVDGLERAEEDFEAAVKQVKTFSEYTRVDSNFLSIVPLLFSSVTPPYQPSPSSFLPPANPKPSISLSSLGIINQIIQPRYDAFEVISSPWVIGGEYSTGYGMFLGTWEGRLGLSAVYNESYHEREEARLFLEKVTGIAMRGLGVKEE